MNTEGTCLQSSFFNFQKPGEGVNCTQYAENFKDDCEYMEGDDPGNVKKNECLGCYIENYCKYISRMFEIQPELSWWL